MNEQRSPTELRLERIALIRATPLWCDALILNVVAHLTFILSVESEIRTLRTYFGSTKMLGSWAYYFLPTFLVIYLPPLIRRRRIFPTLLWSTLVASVFLIMLFPRYVA